MVYKHAISTVVPARNVKLSAGMDKEAGEMNPGNAWLIKFDSVDSIDFVLDSIDLWLYSVNLG